MSIIKSLALMSVTVGLVDFYWIGQKPWSFVGIIGFLLIGWMSAEVFKENL
jgi:hypothetical protein